MQKCLGIYIEENLIKYAKVSKEKEDMKVETFGIRFFENLSEEIDKIIEETFSFNTPISINLANEKYLYFDVFALLKDKDIQRTVETEFEAYCEEKKYNNNAFENRYALMPNIEDKEKMRALDIFINKIEMNRQTDPFIKYKLTKVIPISIAIGNIARLNKDENQIIVNMEETTTVTTIYNNQIYNVDTIEVGSKEVLSNINKLENSYAKAYDICKNTTIYTAESEYLGEEQQYLQQIMPTIFKIAEQLQELISSIENAKIQTMYLTGSLSVINNIDLYFQEYFPNMEVKILKPKIIDETVTKINIKEYVEVNSAIALATFGLGEGIQKLNFKKTKLSEKISLLVPSKKDGKKENEPGKAKKIDFGIDSFKGAFNFFEITMLRVIVGILLMLLIFVIFSKLLSDQMIKKENEISELIESEKNYISKMKSDADSLDRKTNKYKELTADLEIIDRKISEIAARRNSIPNLLNQIMSIIPEKVQLTSIENVTGDTISITAQSSNYDQLGYFIAIIKTKNILQRDTVQSSGGIKSGEGIVSVTIEGELP